MIIPSGRYKASISWLLEVCNDTKRWCNCDPVGIQAVRTDPSVVLQLCSCSQGEMVMHFKFSKGKHAL